MLRLAYSAIEALFKYIFLNLCNNQKVLELLYTVNLWTDYQGLPISPHSRHYSGPSVSAGDWFQDPLQTPKSEDAQVPYINIQSALHTLEFCICESTEG